ncbi:hypothetical protein [Thauera propionica]|nr:hypothetical protein [Thauera propionica]
MRTFSKLATSFWTDDLGRELRPRGPQLQLLAIYLFSNKHSNYTGIYILPKMYIAADLGIDMNSVDAMLRTLEEMNYARYDESTETIWVIDAAREQIGETLKPADKMVKAIQRELSELPKKCVLTAQFIERYADAYHLREEEKAAAPAKRPATAKVETPAPVEAPAQQAAIEEPAWTPADSFWVSADVPTGLDAFIELRNAQEDKRLYVSDEQVVERVLQLQESAGYRFTINALRRAYESQDYDLEHLPEPIFNDI